jgi:hypothetical protein
MSNKAPSSTNLTEDLSTKCQAIDTTKLPQIQMKRKRMQNLNFVHKKCRRTNLHIDETEIEESAISQSVTERYNRALVRYIHTNTNS